MFTKVNRRRVPSSVGQEVDRNSTTGHKSPSGRPISTLSSGRTQPHISRLEERLNVIKRNRITYGKAVDEAPGLLGDDDLLHGAAVPGEFLGENASSVSIWRDIEGVATLNRSPTSSHDLPGLAATGASPRPLDSAGGASVPVAPSVDQPRGVTSRARRHIAQANSGALRATPPPCPSYPAFVIAKHTKKEESMLEALTASVINTLFFSADANPTVP